jgi:hypothetical protein
MTAAKKPITVGVVAAKQLENYSGSKSREVTDSLLNAVINAAWLHGIEDVDAKSRQARIALDLLEAFKPTDAIEGMIAAQAIAMHHGSMECFRRSMIPSQSWEVAARMRKDGANLARGMADMVDALDRKRGKGPQVVRVERVVVHQGGQAIVGNVQASAAAAAGVAAPSPALEQDPPGPMLDRLGAKPKPALVKAGRHGEGGGA